MVRQPSGLKRNIVLARLDAFQTATGPAGEARSDGLKFIEFNAESPAGTGYADLQEEIFFEQGLMAPTLERYDVHRVSRLQSLLEALLSAFAEHPIQGEPRALITDWGSVDTWAEFVMQKEHFDSQGVPTELADTRALEYSNGTLYANGKPVNLVYRRVLLRELLAKKDECQALLRAAEDGAICMANPFCTVIPGTKDVSFMMHHPRFRSGLGAKELAAIDRHVPWTSRLSDEPMDFRGKRWIPLELAAAKKDLFVLKPNDGYGGKDVYMGPETDQTTWENVLGTWRDKAWVLQELIEIPEEPFPQFEGGFSLTTRKVNLNPFALAGEHGGSIARLSTSSVINMSAGGGLVPTMELREKS